MKKIMLVGVLVLAFLGVNAQTIPAAPSKPTATTGKMLYQQYCLSCHQADGSGVPNLNPPLRKTDWVLGDKNRLIGVLLNGLQDTDIEGESYDNVMPPHNFLTDTQLADILTYIRSSFGNKADAVSADEVKAIRAAKK